MGPESLRFAHALGATYCQICNPFQYESSIMGDANQRAAHIKDTSDLIARHPAKHTPGGLDRQAG
jgi:hypothetical protein